MTAIHPLPLILASESESRMNVLKNAGLKFKSYPSRIDESTVTGPIPERETNLAKAKALEVSKKIESPALILAADTVVVLNNKILEKPKYKRIAVDMLLALSDKVHTLVTGWAIYNSYKDIWFTGSSATYVTFRKLDYHEIVGYVNNYPVTTWAAGYNSQLSSAINFITKIDGSLTGLNGLPLDQIIPILHEEWAHPYKKREGK